MKKKGMAIKEGSGFTSPFMCMQKDSKTSENPDSTFNIFNFPMHQPKTQ